MRTWRETYHRAEDAYRRAEETAREAMTLYRNYPTSENGRLVEETAAEARHAKSWYRYTASLYSEGEMIWVEAMRREP
jgi:alpha-amylase/alpha-mannosidase (GH57 family)